MGLHSLSKKLVSEFDKIKQLLHIKKKLSPEQYYLEIKKLNRKIAALKIVVQDNSIRTMPQWISFQNTCFCNLRCPHCWSHGTEELRERHNGMAMEDNMLWALAKETLPLADSFSLSRNGEPLASPHLDKILTELSKYGAKLTLLTNGTLLTSAKLPMLLPIAKSIEISIDGATQHTFEAIRTGATFKKVIHNIRVLTRALELLPENLRPTIEFAWTIMGSNMRELPDIIKLAGALGVSIVNTRFIILIDNDGIKHEAVEYHKPDYNIYYQEAKEIARNLNVTVKLPPPFEDFSNSSFGSQGRENMIIKQPPEDYQEILVTLESIIDNNAVQKEANKIKTEVIRRVSRRYLDVESIHKIYDLQEMREYFESLLEKYWTNLQSIIDKPDETIKFCPHIHKFMYVSPLGDITPCCYFFHVVGNVKTENVRDIWLGKAYDEFRRKVLGNNPFEQCVTCPEMASLKVGTFLEEIFE